MCISVLYMCVCIYIYLYIYIKKEDDSWFQITMVHVCIFGFIIISILVTGGRVVTPYPLAVGTLPSGGRPPFQYILLLSPTGGGNFIDIWSEHAAILPIGGGNLLAVCGLILNVYSVMSTRIIYYPLAVGICALFADSQSNLHSYLPLAGGIKIWMLPAASPAQFLLRYMMVIYS